MEKRKNCLFFIADQLRADSLSCLGNTELTTPNYDALAKEGILFENAVLSVADLRSQPLQL